MSRPPRPPFLAVPGWLYDQPEVRASGTILRVYLAVLSEASNQKYRVSKATWKRVADDTGLGRSCVYRDLAVLRELGAIRDRDDGSFWLPLDDPLESTPVDFESTHMDDLSTLVEKPSTPVDSTVLIENSIIKNQNPPTPRGGAVVAVVDPFDTFWSIYPRRHRKGTARKAWDKAVKTDKVDPQLILAGAARYRDDPNRPQLQFVPHPSSWLNGLGWDDDPEAPRDRAGTRSPVDRTMQNLEPLLFSTPDEGEPNGPSRHDPSLDPPFRGLPAGSQPS